ncbi:MAG TPA: hypothetical protein VKV73_00555 [Chloroflexota bacterium]|nr:hypothetical protein [Chloroflexota bacterium]
MLSDPVILSIVQVPGRVHSCELCSAEPEAIRAAVLVRHARGGAIQFAACERCASAIRRVIAVAGGASSNGPAHVAVDPDVDLAYASASRGAPSVDGVGEPVVLHEYADLFQADDGETYLVRIYGQGRADGTWVGWLEFAATGDGASRRTGQETSQSSRHHAAYWAMGLEPAYFSGAFKRSA